MGANWHTVGENSQSGKVWEDAEKSTGRRVNSVVWLWLEIFEGRMKIKEVAQQKCQALVLGRTKNHPDGKRAEENIVQEGMRKGITGEETVKKKP